MKLPAPRRKRRGIKRNSAEANPPTLVELRRGRLAIHPCGKPQGILAKANKRQPNLKMSLDSGDKSLLPEKKENLKTVESTLNLDNGQNTPKGE